MQRANINSKKKDAKDSNSIQPTKKINQPKKSPNSFNFDTAILELGQSSIQLLKEQKYDQFDPLMGDWSCQLRSIWLVDFLKNNPSLDNLNNEQLRMLGMCRLLTIATQKEVDVYGMILEQYTDTKFRPDGWQNASGVKLRDSYGTAKKQLASMIVDFLKASIENSNVAQKDLVLKLFADETYTSFSGVSIRFVEFFTGYLAVVGLALDKNIPITIALKRFQDDAEEYSVDGVQTLFYKPENGKFICSEPTEDELQAPSMIIEMYSARALQDGNSNVFDFVKEGNFENFIQGFKSLDLVDIILAIAATHPQFPKQASVLVNKEKVPVVGIRHQDHLSDLYKHYLDWGQDKKIGTEKYYSRVNVDTPTFFKSNISVNTEHVYISTYQQVSAKLADFFNKHKTEKVRLNEIHQSTSTPPRP